MFIGPALHQDINRVAILIHRPPQILPFPLDDHKDFVDVPGIAQASLPFFEFVSIARTKLLTPLANSFIGDGDPSFGKKLFHFPEAQTESMVQPRRMANNF